MSSNVTQLLQVSPASVSMNATRINEQNSNQNHQSSQTNETKKGYSDVRLRGYSYVREYYSPSYENKKAENKMEDIRSLLYWNPALITNRKGEAEFKYSNSDSVKKHQIVIEGISDMGEIILLKKLIGTENQ